MTSPAMARDPERVTGRNRLGNHAEWILHSVQLLPSAGSLLTVDLVELNDRSTLLRKRLPADLAGSAASDLAERQLDNEIRALTRLATRYPGGSYPAELPVLAGYDFDSATPFVLIRPYVGDAADGRLRTLLTDERRTFMIGLFRALAELCAVDLVHGSVGLPALRWDGATAQLVGFEHTAHIGEQVRSRVPVAANGNRPGESRPIAAHPGDDVLAAGLAIHQMVTGRRPDIDSGSHTVDPAGLPQSFAAVLRDVFQPDPAHRPTALELLERLNAGGGLPSPVDMDGPLRSGRERFDELRPPAPQVVPPMTPVMADPLPFFDGPRRASTPVNRRSRGISVWRKLSWPLRISLALFVSSVIAFAIYLVVPR